MFGKHLRLKRFLGGIVVTAAVAVVAVPSALSSTSSRGGTAGAPDVLARYVANHADQAQQVQGYRFVTDTLGGTRHPVALQVPSNRFTSDASAPVGAGIAANGYNSNAYVNGGATPSVAEKIQESGYNQTPEPVATGGSGGGSSTWRDIAIVSLGAIALMLLLGALRASRQDEPTVRTA